MRSRKRFAIAAMLVVMLSAIGLASGAAQAALTFFITEVDASAFPQVSFSMRAVELGNKVVGALNESTLTVYENGEQVDELSVTQHEDGPITWIIVIDQGRASSYRSFGKGNLRQAISTLVSGDYFQDGIDTVMVLARVNETSDQTEVLLPPTQDGSELTTRVADFNLDPSARNTSGLLGVSDAIERLQEVVPVPGSQTTAILLITRYIEDPSRSVAPSLAENIAAEARLNNTSVHVFQTDFNRYRHDELEVLATGSDGSYSALTRNNYASAVASVYQSIDSQRTYYSVSYRSPVAEGEQREITINSPSRPSEGVVGTFQISLLPASISVTEPMVGSIIRREAILPEEEGGLPSFDTGSILVKAEVSWPDGFPRNLAAADLSVNGNPEDSIEPSPGQTTLEFEWDASDIDVEGLNPITLTVDVEDELGRVSTVDAVVTVEVVIPPTPTPPGIEISPTAAALSLPAFCLIGVLVAGIGGGAIYFLRRRVAISPAGAPAQEEPEVSPTLIASDASDLALGTVTVLEGPAGLIGEDFKITTLKTKLGRDPAQADISFYSEEESSVSRLHCTISLDDDNFFRLIDNNSSSGTRLNGRKIQADSPVVLDHGDEIVLGNLAQRGVKLRFNFPSEEELQGGYSGSADDRTHFMDDDDLADWPSEEES